MAEIYLDNAATTRTDPDIAEQVAKDLLEHYANPSSVHGPGVQAARRLADARRELLACFRWPGAEAVFTASGSEALNLAVKGAFQRRRKGQDRVVISAVEHPAVVASARQLAQVSGARVDEAPVDGAGRLDLDRFAALLADDVAVACVMHVNNELGTIEPVAAAGAAVRERAPRAAFVVDAVQGLGKADLDPAAWRADAVAVASHKVHGPKGVGALVLRPDLARRLEPAISGGGQEGGLRSGTENVAGAAGFARAASRAAAGLREHAAHCARLRARLLDGLRARIDDVLLNGPDDPALASPAILCLSFPGAPSEPLLHALEQDGIYVSAGSACHSKAKQMSHVHRACGFPEWRADSALRFGLSRHTREAEVDHAVERVAARVALLRRLGGRGSG